MNFKKNLSALLAGGMLAGMLPAAGAAASPVVEYEASGRYAELQITGVPAGQKVHSAQLELTLPGLHSATLSTDREKDIALQKVVQENDQTTLTIYVDSLVSIAEEGSISLGTLTFANTETTHSFQGTGKLILLDERQDPISEGTVTVRRSGTGGSTVTPTPSEPEPDTGEDSPSGNRKPYVVGGGSTGSPVEDVSTAAPLESPAETRVPAFTDVPPTEWYASAVSYVYRYGMMSGTSATAFSPNTATNRAMIVSILYRLEGSPAAGSGNFPDVAAGQYYTGAVAWAAENGIVSGGTDGRFHPDGMITREQLAAILYRYAQFKGYTMASPASLAAFSDADAVSAYAREAMGWAVAQGLISGTNRGTLDPLGGATRAQAASILMRFCQSLADMP